jgi:hypothetical protein
LPLHTSPKQALAVCAIFRDEAPYLSEWVTFHRLMGVEAFYLYDNGSTDDWRRALAPELASGVVHVTPWSHPPGHAQLAAYRHCLEHGRRRVRWLAFIDIDEFLFSPSGRSLTEVLSEFADCPGVVVGWRLYGTSGWTDPPPGLVTENFLLRAPENHVLTQHGKSIVDPRRTLSHITSAHAFIHYRRWVPWKLAAPVDETGQPYGGYGTPVKSLRINHYYVRSEAMAKAKFRRGPANNVPQPPLTQLLDPRLNEIRDDAILPFVPDLRRRLQDRA